MTTHRHTKNQLPLPLLPAQRKENAVLSPEVEREIVSALSQMLTDALNAIAAAEGGSSDEH